MIRRWSAHLEPAFAYGMIAGALLVSARGLVACLLGLLLLGVTVLLSLETLVRCDVQRQSRREASQIDVARQLRRIL